MPARSPTAFVVISSRVLHDIDRDLRPAANTSLPRTAGEANGADEQLDLWLADGKGVSYNKQRLHKVGYFADLMSSNDEIDDSIRPLLKLSRETIARSQKLDYALVSSLERDPPAQWASLLNERQESAAIQQF